MIHIPLGNDHKATASASVWQPVTCEHCGCNFVYYLVVHGVGQAMSPLFLREREAAKKATERAAVALEQSIPSAWRLAPCPGCGKYQRATLRAERLRRINTGMTFFALAAAIGGVAAYLSWESVFLAVLGAVAILGAGLVWNLRGTGSIEASARVRKREAVSQTVLTLEEYKRRSRAEDFMRPKG